MNGFECAFGVWHNAELDCRCTEIYICKEMDIKSAHDFSEWCNKQIITQAMRDSFLIAKENAIRENAHPIKGKQIYQIFENALLDAKHLIK